MVITSRTRTTLFNANAATSPDSKTLIRLPLSVVPHYERRCEVTGAIVPKSAKPLFRPNLWSSDEHERFLRGLEMFPNGPWKQVAKVVGTKTTRQTMTHAQKYRQKIERRMTMKPKEETKSKRTRRRKTQRSVDECEPVVSFQAMMHSVGQAPMATGGSPTDVYNDAFDVSFLDQEFDAILASLEPLDHEMVAANSSAFVYPSSVYTHSF